MYWAWLEPSAQKNIVSSSVARHMATRELDVACSRERRSYYSIEPIPNPSGMRGDSSIFSELLLGLCSWLPLQHPELHSSIHRPALFAGVRLQGLGFAIAFPGKSLVIDLLLHQVVHHGFRAIVAQLQVVGVAALVIGVAFYFGTYEGVVRHHIRQLVQFFLVAR